MEITGLFVLTLAAVVSADFSGMGMSMGGDNSMNGMNMQQQQQQQQVFVQQPSQLSGQIPVVAQCLECDDKDSSNIVRVLSNKNVNTINSNQVSGIMPAAVQTSGGFDMLLDNKMLNAVPPPQNLLTTTILETFATNYQGIPVTGKRTRISVYYANQAATAGFGVVDNRGSNNAAATPMYQSNPGQMLVYYSNNGQQSSFNGGGQQTGMGNVQGQPQPAVFVQNPQPSSFTNQQQSFTGGSSSAQDLRTQFQSGSQSPSGSGLIGVNVVGLPSSSSSNQDGMNIQFLKANQGTSGMSSGSSMSNGNQFVTSGQSTGQFGMSGQNMGQSNSGMASSGNTASQFATGSMGSQSNSGMMSSGGSNVGQLRVTSGQGSSGQGFGQSSGGGMISGGSNVGQFGVSGGQSFGQSNSGQSFGQSNGGMMSSGSNNVGQFGVSNQLSGQGTSNMFSGESARSGGSNVAVMSGSSSQSGSQFGNAGVHSQGGMGGRNLDTSSSQGNLVITSAQSQNGGMQSGGSMQSGGMNGFQGLTPQATRDQNTFTSASSTNGMSGGGGYQSISAYNIQGTDGFVTVGSVTFVAAGVGSPFTTVTDIRTISPTINQPPGSFMTSSSRLEAFFAPVSNTRIRGERTRFAYYYVLGDANTAAVDQRNGRISTGSTSYAAVNNAPTPALISVPQVVYQGSGRSGMGSDFNTQGNTQQVNQVSQPTNQQFSFVNNQQGTSQAAQGNIQQVNPFGQPTNQPFNTGNNQQGSFQVTNQQVNQISQPNSQQFGQGNTLQVNQGTSQASNQDLFAGTSQQVPRVLIVPGADTSSQQVQSTAQPAQINLQNIQGQSFTNQQDQNVGHNFQGSSLATQLNQFGGQNQQNQNSAQTMQGQSSATGQNQFGMQNQQGQLTVQSPQGQSGSQNQQSQSSANQQVQSGLQVSQGQSGTQTQQGSSQGTNQQVNQINQLNNQQSSQGNGQRQQGQLSSNQQNAGNSQSSASFTFGPSQRSTYDQNYNTGLVDMSSGTMSKNTLNIVSLPTNQASGRSDNVNTNTNSGTTKVLVAPLGSLSNANSNIQFASVGTGFNMSDQSGMVNNGATAQSGSEGTGQNRAMLVFNPTNIPIQFGSGFPVATQSSANGTNAIAVSSASSTSSGQGANAGSLQAFSSSQGNTGANNFRQLRSLNSRCDGSGFCRITQEQ